MRTFKSFRVRQREAIRKRCSRMGKASQKVQAAKRVEREPPVYPPMRGELLMVDRVTNVLQGCSVSYEIRVGDRLNRIDVYSFGRLIQGLHTWTQFFDLRRRRMAVKWITE